MDSFSDTQYFYISDDSLSGLNGITVAVVAASLVNGHVSYDLADAAIDVGFDTAMGGQVYTSGGVFEGSQKVSLSEDPGGKAVSISAPAGVSIGVAVIYIKSHGCVRLFIDGGDRSLDEELANIPLPIYANGDGDTDLPISVYGVSPDLWAGWQSALPAGGVVRMTGFNLPRTLTCLSAHEQTTINAEGGDYGIEFTIPQDSESVAIFDETFWLYIR